MRGERRWPRKELEEREREVMELWSAAMAAIVLASLNLAVTDEWITHTQSERGEHNRVCVDTRAF